MKTPRPNRTAARKGDRPTGRKVDLKLALSPEAVHRLKVQAVGEGLRPSAVVEALILAHCRRFVLSDREKPAENPAVVPMPRARDAAGEGGADAA